MTSSQTAPGPAATDPDPDSGAAAADMIAAAAAAWLTPDAVTVIGHQVAASITAYRLGTAGPRPGPKRWPGSTPPC